MVSFLLLSALLHGTLAPPARQQAAPEQHPSAISNADTAPLPDPQTLLAEVEQNQHRLETAQRDYTYHVHTVTVDVDSAGKPKKTETVDAESITLQGVRVDRVLARDGKPLTPEQQSKEDRRIQEVIAKAQERRSKAAESGKETDSQGNPELSLSRILELGSFTNERRITLDGRPTLVLDYHGNPGAKTHNSFETVFRDLAGTVWIDEADRVLVRGQGQLVNDFKLGGGLLADVHKGTQFDFRARQVNGSIWLPGTIEASGSARVFLLAGFRGHLTVQTSDYRRFRTSATILGSNGPVTTDPETKPPASAAAPATNENQPH